MNEKKSRTLLFVLGITIGLLLGATIVFISTPKPNSNGEVSENMIEQIVNKVYGLISIKKEAKDSLLTKSDEATKTTKNKILGSVKKDAISEKNKVDSIASIAEHVAAGVDSMHLDSTVVATVTSVNINDDIVVKKDELLVAKMVDMINLDYSSTKTTTNTDSILQVVSGIRDNSKIVDAKYSYQVEVWKSPINYRGYKFSKNKLVLFGVDENAPLKLIFLSDNTYLKYADAYYRLDNYNDYKAFEKVSNPQLIALLNK